MEFGVEIGEYRGVVGVPRRVFQRLLPRPPHPSGVSKPTNCSGPAAGALPSERLVACRWARMEAGDQGRDEVPDERRVALYKVGSHLVLYTPAWVRSATGNNQSYAAFSP